MKTLLRLAAPLAFAALTLSAQVAGEPKPGDEKILETSGPTVTLTGTMVDAGCRNRTALNMKQAPETFASATPAQTPAEAQAGAQQRAAQGYQNPQAPAQQPTTTIASNGITVDPKTLALERHDILLHQEPDLRSRQMDPTCAVTAATHNYAIILNDNGRMLNFDDGGNTFATEAVLGSPTGRTMMSGNGGGFKPAATVKGVIHDDRLVVKSLKLTK